MLGSGKKQVTKAIVNAAYVSRTSDTTAAGVVELTNETETADENTGALVVHGGVAIQKDLRVTGDIYKNGVPVQAGEVSFANVGTTPSPKGATIDNQIITLQPADATRPGVVSTDAQSFLGVKTFLNKVFFQGGIEALGTTTFLNTTELEVKDAFITVNKGGTNTSAELGGFEVERVTGGNGAVVFDSTVASKWKLGISGTLFEVIVSGITQTIAGLKTFTSLLTTSDIKIDGKLLKGIQTNTQSGTAITLTNPTKPVVALNNAALVSVTDITAPSSDSQTFVLINNTGVEISFINGTLVTGTGADLTLATGKTLQWVYDSTTTKWRVVGGTGSGTASGSGGVNYITNPDFDSNVTGWYASRNASATTEPDGTFFNTGVTNTFTRSTTAPLTGVGSAIYQLGAIGNQAYSLFTIATAHKGKMLSFKMDYAIASGAYADDTVQMWVRDLTNGKNIPVSPGFIKNHGLESDTFVGEFQSAHNSTSYALVMHQRLASTAALKIDNVSVGPSAFSVPTGPVTVFASKQGAGHTATNSWQDVTSYTAATQTGTGFNATTGVFTVQTPGDYEIDAHVLFATVGTGASRGCKVLVNGNATGVGSFTDGVGYRPLNASGLLRNLKVGDTIKMSAYQDSGGTLNYIADPEVCTRLSIRLVNVGANAGAEPRVVATSVHATTPTSTFNTTPQRVSFGAATTDTHGCWNGSTTYTCKVPGVYDVRVSLCYYSGGTSAHVRLSVRKNGVEFIQNLDSVGANFFNTIKSDGLVELKTGDTLEVWQNATSTCAFQTESTLNYFEVQKLSGPSQIAASESVTARYTTNAGQSVGGGTLINFDLKDYDSHNAVTTGVGVWKFTAPISGKYSVTGFISESAVSRSAGSNAQAYLHKNGVFHSRPGFHSIQTTSGGIEACYPIVGEVSLNAGETIQLIRDGSTSATLDSSPGRNWIAIKRVGN